MSKEWEDLDPSLITSDICIQCGRCCKVSWSKPYKEETEEYLRAMFELSSRSFVKVQPTNSGQKITVENWCSNLMPDLKCRIYENRPLTCQRYNCFEMANAKKKMPEYYDFVKGLIDAKRGTGSEVAGVD